MRYIIFILLVSIATACSPKVEPLIKPDLTGLIIDSNDIRLTFSPDSVLADGTTFGQATLQVKPSLVSTLKNASFEISPIGKFNNGNATIQSTLDISGVASAFVSSETAGLANLKVTTGSFVRTAIVKFYTAPSDSLKAYTVTTTGIADNAAYVEIVVTRKGPAKGAFLQVSFSTDKGSFSNNNPTYGAQIGPNDTLHAYLKSQVADLAKVTVSVPNSFQKDLWISFGTAWPSQILVEPQSAVLTVQINASATIKARLFRPTGMVSTGFTPSFSDSTAEPNGRSIGSFINTTSSTSVGEVETQYVLQDTSYKGLVYIRSWVQTDAGQVTGESRILLQK